MKMLTLDEAATETGWHKSQVSRWIKRLNFGRQVDGTIKLTVEEVAALVAVKKAARPGNRRQ